MFRAGRGVRRFHAFRHGDASIRLLCARREVSVAGGRGVDLRLIHLRAVAVVGFATRKSAAVIGLDNGSVGIRTADLTPKRPPRFVSRELCMHQDLAVSVVAGVLQQVSLPVVDGVSRADFRSARYLLVRRGFFLYGTHRAAQLLVGTTAVQDTLLLAQGKGSREKRYDQNNAPRHRALLRVANYPA